MNGIVEYYLFVLSNLFLYAIIQFSWWLGLGFLLWFSTNAMLLLSLLSYLLGSLSFNMTTNSFHVRINQSFSSLLLLTLWVSLCDCCCSDGNMLQIKLTLFAYLILSHLAIFTFKYLLSQLKASHNISELQQYVFVKNKFTLLITLPNWRERRAAEKSSWQF